MDKLNRVLQLVHSYARGVGVEAVLSPIAADLSKIDDNSLDYIALVQCVNDCSEFGPLIAEWFPKLRIDGSIIIVMLHRNMVEGPTELLCSSEKESIEAVVSTGLSLHLHDRGVDDGGSCCYYVVFTKENEETVEIPRYNPSLPVAEAVRKTERDGEIVISRMDGVGDMIFMAPAIRCLKSHIGTARLVMHTRPRYAGIAKMIGFDDVSTSERERGIALNWALEDHPAFRILDRVSLWEDILHLPIEDTLVTMRADEQNGRGILQSHPSYDAGKQTLYFCPFSIYASRSFHPHRVDEMIGDLLLRYNVVMLTAGVPQSPPSTWDAVQLEFMQERERSLLYCEAQGCCVFKRLSISDWFSLVSACDLAVSSDTAGIYVASALGVPAVGFYEHVEPWLRLRRFGKVRGVSVRQKKCKCSHHGPCTRDDEYCRNSINAELVIDNIDSLLSGDYGYFDAEMQPIRPPSVLFAMDTDGGRDLATTYESINTAIRGLSVCRSAADFGTACIIPVKAGATVSRPFVWNALTTYVKENA